MNKLIVLIIVVLGVFVFSCTDPEAEKKCEDLIEKFCSKIDSCSLFTSKADCISAVKTSINCGKAVDVSDDYDRCMKEIDELTCSVATTSLPASCHGVIKVEE